MLSSQINPQHTIPAIKDGDLVLWESRAILGYLVNKYGKDDQYYPKDAVKRAVVDQRLYFDMGTLYKSFAEYFYPQFKEQAPADPAKFKKMGEAYEFLNRFLEGKKYTAGDQITIADFAILATVSTAVVCAGFSLDKYPNVLRWYKDAQENAPGYERTVPALEAIKAMLAKAKPEST